MRKLTLEEVIIRITAKHGTDIDCSEVKSYDGSNIPIKNLKCLKNSMHRYFERTYNDLVFQGFGCPDCSTRWGLSQEEAMNRCVDMWGDNYDLSKMKYDGYDEKVEIGCKIHGWVWLRYSHFIKTGCPRCGDLRGARKQRSNLDEVKKKISRIHKNKYDYSLITDVNYINYNIKVPIICPIHGIFWQDLGSHLKGMGCPKCVGREKSTEDFVREAIEVHGDKYDYIKVIYVGALNKVIIICKKCGREFRQTPSAHINGQGCPSCKESTGEKLIEKILKENNIGFIPQKTFDGCKRIKKLRFDFYIPNKNILIEYDGGQHFFVVKWYGGEAFKITQIKDEIKNKYCDDNNIVLIRLPYWLEDEELEEILLNDITNN